MRSFTYGLSGNDAIVAFVGHPVASQIGIPAHTGQPFNIFESTGVLPSGLSLDRKTGIISGSPVGVFEGDILIQGSQPGGYPENVHFLLKADPDWDVLDGAQVDHPMFMQNVYPLTSADKLSWKTHSIDSSQYDLGSRSSMPFRTMSVEDAISVEVWVRRSANDPFFAAGLIGPGLSINVALTLRSDGIEFLNVVHDTFGSRLPAPEGGEPDPNFFGFFMNGAGIRYVPPTSTYFVLGQWTHVAAQIKRVANDLFQFRIYMNGEVVAHCVVLVNPETLRTVCTIDPTNTCLYGPGGWNSNRVTAQVDHYMFSYGPDISGDWVPNGRVSFVEASEGAEYGTDVNLTVLPQPVIALPSSVTVYTGVHYSIFPFRNFSFSEDDDPDLIRVRLIVDEEAVHGETTLTDTGVSGLLFNQHDGSLEGTPLADSEMTEHELYVEMPEDTVPGITLPVSSNTMTLRVLPPPVVSYPSGLRFAPGQSVSIEPVTPYALTDATWSIVPLPASQPPVWLTLDPVTGVLTGTVPDGLPQQVVGFSVRVSNIDSWEGDDPETAVSFNVAPDGAFMYEAITLLPSDTERTVVRSPDTEVDVSDPGVTFSVEPALPANLLTLDTATGTITANFGGGPAGLNRFEALEAQYTVTMHSTYHPDEDLQADLFVSVQPVPTMCGTLSLSYVMPDLFVDESFQVDPVAIVEGENNRPWQYVCSRPDVLIDEWTGRLTGTPDAATSSNTFMTVTATCGSSSVQIVTIPYVVFGRFWYDEVDVVLGRQISVNPPNGVSADYHHFSTTQLLPSGLSLHPDTGVLHGRPTAWLGESLTIEYDVHCVHLTDGTLGRGTLVLRLEEEDEDPSTTGGTSASSKGKKPVTSKADTTTSKGDTSRTLTGVGAGLASVGVLGMIIAAKMK